MKFVLSVSHGGPAHPGCLGIRLRVVYEQRIRFVSKHSLIKAKIVFEGQ